MAYSPTSPRFIEARNHGGRQDLRPCKRIVIHGTTGVNSCRPGYARIIARYFQTTERDASAQYVVDPSEVLQCVGDHTVVYGAPPNEDVLHVELCDPVEGPLSRWNDKNHRAMLKRAARLVAELCLAYDVPVKRRHVAGLRLGRRGICGHIDVSKAWGQTSHWDPGAFPWRRFMRLVRAEAKAIKAASEPIVPEPKKPTRSARPASSSTTLSTCSRRSPPSASTCTTSPTPSPATQPDSRRSDPPWQLTPPAGPCAPASTRS